MLIGRNICQVSIMPNIAEEFNKVKLISNASSNYHFKTWCTYACWDCTMKIMSVWFMILATGMSLTVAMCRVL